MSEIISLEGYYFKDELLRTGISDVEAYIGYPDETKIVGLCADFENNTFTRLAGAVGKTAGSDFNVFNMYGNRKLCNLADDGTVNAWYGDVNYTEDGSNGQVMVWQPKFYYRTVPLKLERIEPEEITTGVYTEPQGYHMLKVSYYLSDTPRYGFKVHPAFLAADGVTELDGIFMSAYEGSVWDYSENRYLQYDDIDVYYDSQTGDPVITPNTYTADETTDKFSSVAGVKPASGKKSILTRSNMEAMCNNRGTGWHTENLQVVSMEMLLTVVEYASFNTQTAIGEGVTNTVGTYYDSDTVQTGATASLGNGSGISTATTMLISTGFTNYTTASGEDTMSVRYRGRENDWGNLYKFIGGLNVYGNGKQRGGIPYYCTDYNYTENKKNDNYVSTGITVVNGHGYAKYFGWSEDCDWTFLTTMVGGTSALPVGDYNDFTINLDDEYRVPAIGGAWYNVEFAGEFYWVMDHEFNVHREHIGGRIMYIPS